MIPAKSCHYTTKFNSERHKSTIIFSIHSSKILFFPYSLYYWAFQDPPYRHRRCKVNTPSSSMQAHFVKLASTSQSILALAHIDAAKLRPILRTAQYGL